MINHCGLSHFVVSFSRIVQARHGRGCELLVYIGERQIGAHRECMMDH